MNFENCELSTPKFPDTQLSIAFITSVDRGLPGIPFPIYRELEYYEKQNVDIHLFLFRDRKGILKPKESWNIYSMNPIRVAVAQIHVLLKHPRKYLTLLREALHLNSLFEFLIAGDFMRKMNNSRLIHSFYGDHKLNIGYFCSKFLNKPLSVAIHGYEMYINRNWIMFQKALEHCSLIVATNAYFYELLTQKFHISQDKIIVARTPVNFEKFQPGITKSIGHGLGIRGSSTGVWKRIKKLIESAESKFKILTVARLVWRKGIQDLIEAINKLEFKEQLSVWLVGDGPERPNIESLIQKYALQNIVHLLGAIADDNLLFLYDNCDLYVQPSKTDRNGDKEGFPVALAEAMAFAKPVITTRHADIPNVVERILIDEGNVEQLAEAIKNIYLMNSDERANLGTRNLEIVRKNFSIQNYVITLEKLTQLCYTHWFLQKRVLKTVIGEK